MLHGGKWPKALGWSGIPAGGCFLLTVPAAIYEIEILNLIAAGDGAVFSPIWHIWMGARLITPSAWCRSKAGLGRVIASSGSYGCCWGAFPINGGHMYGQQRRRQLCSFPQFRGKTL